MRSVEDENVTETTSLLNKNENNVPVVEDAAEVEKGVTETTRKNVLIFL